MIRKALLFGAVFALALTTVTNTFAKPVTELDQEVQAAVTEFKANQKGATEVITKAKGILVFPEITKGGLGVAVEGGTGALMVNDKIVAHYRTKSASLGVTAGIQKKSMMLAFMTDEALKNFQESKGWEVGVDGSVAMITTGEGKTINTNNIKEPVAAFVWGTEGLMLDASIDGTKISKLDDEDLKNLG